MSMSRRELVSMGVVLGVAALGDTKAQGQVIQGDKPPQASGKVAQYGEGSSSYFALAKMPGKIEAFHIDSRINDRLGRLVLAAAEKGWEIEVTYTLFPDGTAGQVYDVRVKSFVVVD
jgi:hypothetical protein